MLQKKAFQTYGIEIKYNCAKRYHILWTNCAKGIVFGLLTVLNVTIFLLGERTGLVVRALDSGSGDPGSILGRVGVLFP